MAKVAHRRKDPADTVLHRADHDSKVGQSSHALLDNWCCRQHSQDHDVGEEGVEAATQKGKLVEVSAGEKVWRR